MEIFKGEDLFSERIEGRNWLLKRDANIAYFQANGQRWKGDNPQVYGIATVFEGRVFNPNLLIQHKGTKEYSQVLAVELSIQPWIT